MLGCCFVFVLASGALGHYTALELNTAAQDFNLSIYSNDCTPDYAVEEEVRFVHHNSGVQTTAADLLAEFQQVVDTAMQFACTGNSTAGQNAILLSRKYVQKCAESGEVVEGSARDIEALMRAVELLTGLTTDHNEMDQVNRTLTQNSENDTIVAEKRKQLLDLLNSYVKKAVDVAQYMQDRGLSNVLLSNHSAQLLDTAHWRSCAQELLLRIRQDRYKDVILYVVKPVVMTAMLLLGTCGNGLLLLIFVRHSDTRGLPNVMLLNLTVVDCFSLLFNLLLDYVRIHVDWTLGLAACKMFYVIRYVLVGVSTYSVVMISLQRFLAVRQVAVCRLGRKTKYLCVATVWVLGLALAVPHGVVADLENGTLCYELSYDHFGAASIFDLAVFCVVPLLLVSVTSFLTASRIRSSVRGVPGESSERLKAQRAVSATILLALVVLFVVSYAPDFVYKFVYFGLAVRGSLWEFYLANTTTYYLRFVNCCLNPFVLFVMSSRFRNLAKKYIPSRKDSSGSQSSVVTQESSI